MVNGEWKRIIERVEDPSVRQVLSSLKVQVIAGTLVVPSERDKSVVERALASAPPPLNLMRVVVSSARRKPPSRHVRFSFSNFVVGRANEFAFHAVKELSAPITRANSVFLRSDRGLGKTHLLSALHNALSSGGLSVTYHDGKSLTSTLFSALKSSSLNSTLSKLKSSDALIVEDVHLIKNDWILSTLQELIEEFLRDGKVVAVSSTASPPPNLSITLRGGISAEISPPDPELRYEILKRKSRELNASLPDDVLAMIADRVASSVRDLEGVLKSVILAYEINPSLSLADVEPLVSRYSSKRRIPAMRVVECVSEITGVSKEEMCSQTRTKRVVLARQIAMFLIRKLMEEEFSYKQIAYLFNRKDHTTVIHAIRKVAKELDKGNEEVLNVVRRVYLSLGVTPL